MGAKRTGDGRSLISEADLFKLLRVSKDAVLIGGQALAFWVAYFRLPIPSGPRTYVSHDADFLGLSRHVEQFSKAIGGRAVYPPRHQITGLEGVVMVKTATGEAIGVDVLRSVVGLKSDAVRKKAIPISDPKDPNLTFKVMHPIDCIVSRFENLRTLSEKRNEIGVWQAQISIGVCRAYIEMLIAAGDEREAIRAATGVLEAAGATPGLQAFRKYGLDLLDGIPIERFTSNSFKLEQYARTAARIRKLRDAFQPPPAK